MKFIDSTNIKKYILNNLNQVKILSHFLGISEANINDCIKNHSYKISNPLRLDSNPSMGFRYYSTTSGFKLITRDFGNSFYSGDIFNIVGIVTGKNPYNPKEFVEILYLILKSQNDEHTYSIGKSLTNIPKKTNQFTIEIEPRPMNIIDYSYWFKYGITPEYLYKFNVTAVAKYWKNDYLTPYRHSETDPCYCYYLDSKNELDICKLYFPLRSKLAQRFDTNNINYLEGSHELRPNKIILITKSRKDKILISRIIDELSIKNLTITNANSEQPVPINIATHLSKFFDYIYVMFDYDIPGIEAMNETYKNTGILHPFSLPVVCVNQIESKDISDFCANNGYSNTVKLFENLYNNYFNKY